MSDELRMELSDCGSPEKLISVILKHNAHWSPPVPIEDFARTVVIEGFQDLEVETFEGALMTDPEKTRGIILIKTGTAPKRRRFTIGHELGHFLIPSHKGNRNCTLGDLRETRRDTAHRRQEAEANRFSAGLLMPRPWFVRDMRAMGDADVTHIQRLADTYDVSLEACANRYVELTDDTCAVVFSKDGIIRYTRRSTTFPFLSVKKGDRVPKDSASLNAPPAPLRVPTPWADLDSGVWLETKWGKAPPRVLEQSVRQANRVEMTLLFLESREADDDEDDDEDVKLEESWTPRFHKR
jgi:Zn-dependent peptidase ImmA (M78 family)